MENNKDVLNFLVNSGILVKKPLNDNSTSINIHKEANMKLIYCPHCKDVVRLKKALKKCDCGKCFGKYEEDGLNASISEDSIPLGFSNHSFIEAVASTPSKDLGKRFDAFVICKDATTIKVKK